MIELRSLEKRFGAMQALAGISLSVGDGELFAYLGPNGSGKTTTVRILTGTCLPDAGTAHIAGHDVVREPLAARLASGLVSQHSSLDPDLSVRENLDVHGRLFRLPRRVRRSRIDELLPAFGLEARAEALVRTLSGGLVRRTMIARALMHRPTVLFLDEPTVGLDPGMRRQFWSLIKRIQKDGTTIFLTTHYLEEAEVLADQVAFLEGGRLLRLESPQRLVAELGEWAIDGLDSSATPTRFFTSREEAQAALASGSLGLALRRVTLEDAFLVATRRSDPP